MDERGGIFERRGMGWFTHVGFPLIALGAVGYLAWLVGGEVEGAAARCLLGLVAGAAAFPLAGAAWLGWMRATGRERTNAWTMAGFAAAAVGYLWWLFPAMGTVMTGIRDADSIGIQWLFTVFLGLLPVVYAAVGRSMGGGGRNRRRWWIATGAIAAVGVAMMALVLLPNWYRLFGRAGRVPDWCEVLFAVGGVVLYVAGSLAVLFGLLRLGHWLGWKRSEGPRKEAWRVAEAVLFGLALPLAGLALNARIPFPADFASPWAWGIAVAAGLLLLSPVRGDWVGLAGWAGRWAAGSYVIYFFLLFLPFLPLAGLSVMIMGAGILMVAPLLLFQFWCQDVAALRAALRGRYGQGALCAVAAAAFLAGPAVWAAGVEVERLQVKALVAWHAGEDFDAPETPPPMGMRRAAAIMRGVNDYRFGVETPLLTAWRTWRVYGGMHMANPLRQALNRRILGREVRDARDWEKKARNFFGNEMFGAARGRGAAEWFSAPARTRNFAVPRVEGDGEGGYAVALEARRDAFGGGDQELVLEMRLPAGAWLEGARLKMPGGEWKEARARERKAAEWMYLKVAHQRAQDPLLVTLDSPTEGKIRVFPVGGKEAREVELKVRLPAAGASEWVAAFRAPEDNGAKAGEWVRAEAPEGMGAAAENQYVAAGAEVTWVGPTVAAALEMLAEEGMERVGEGWADRIVDVRTRLDEGEGEAAAFAADDPDLARKLRRVLRAAWRRLESEGAAAGAPKVAFSRDGADVPAAEAAKKLSAEEKGMLRREFPGLEWLGDRAVDAWFFFPREGGGWVPVPWRRGEPALGFGRVAGGAETGGAWAEGAKAWEVERQAFLYPGQDRRAELLALTRRTGVLTTKAAYIVLENTIQEKELAMDEQRALHAGQSMEFHETKPEEPEAFAATPEPGTLGLLALGAAALAAASARRARRREK